MYNNSNIPLARREGQCAADIGRVVKCGITVTDCGGFVGTLVTELTQKMYRQERQGELPQRQLPLAASEWLPLAELEGKLSGAA